MFKAIIAAGAIALSGAVATMSSALALDLTVAVSNAPDDPSVIVLEQIKEKLANGKTGLTLTIFPNGQMGSETDYVEQMRVGALSMTTVSNAVLSNFSPAVGVLDIPYLLRPDNDNAWKVLDGPIGDKLAEQVRKDTGLIVIGWWNAGLRSIYTRDKAVEKPEDLQGLRIRVMGSPVYVDTFTALGAQPVAMPLSEVYTSLATGAIDAGEADPSGFRVQKFYEQAKNYALVNYVLLLRPLLISGAVYDGMTAEQREEFDAIIKEATAEQRAIFAKRYDEDVAYIEQQGVAIMRPDPEPFRQAVASILDKYAQKLGADIVKEIQDAQQD